MSASSAVVSQAVGYHQSARLTIHLGLKPAEGSTVELLIRCTIGEAIRDGDVRKVLENATLHRQFVQIASLVSGKKSRKRGLTHVSSNEMMPSGSVDELTSAMVHVV